MADWVQRCDMHETLQNSVAPPVHGAGNKHHKAIVRKKKREREFVRRAETNWRDNAGTNNAQKSAVGERNVENLILLLRYNNK